MGSKDKQFLPRMGSVIKFVTNAPDNMCIATSHTDNGIQQLRRYAVQGWMENVDVSHKGHHLMKPLNEIDSWRVTDAVDE